MRDRAEARPAAVARRGAREPIDASWATRLPAMPVMTHPSRSQPNYVGATCASLDNRASAAHPPAHRCGQEASPVRHSAARAPRYALSAHRCGRPARRRSRPVSSSDRLQKLRLQRPDVLPVASCARWSSSARPQPAPPAVVRPIAGSRRSAPRVVEAISLRAATEVAEICGPRGRGRSRRRRSRTRRRRRPGPPPPEIRIDRGAHRQVAGQPHFMSSRRR